MREPFEHVRLRSLVGWLVATLVILVIGFVASGDTFSTLSPGLDIVAMFVLFYGSLAFWAFGEIWMAQVRPGVLLKRGIGDLGVAKVAALVAAGLLFGISSTWLLDYALIQVGGEGIVEALTPDRALGENWNWAVTSTMVVIIAGLAPVVEEVIFRGLILRSWAYRYSLNKAILVPALVFGLGHPGFLPGAFVLGLLYAVIYLRTRSLWVPIILHALNNGSALLMGELWFEGVEPGVQVAVAAAILAWSSAYLGLFMYREWPRPAAAPPEGPLADSA